MIASTLGEDPIEVPFLCLVASGGHTFLARVDDPAAYTLLGQTLDDAAGEAFDFPRSTPGELDFSFSGVKTSLLYTLRDNPDASHADLAASYQRAIVDALVGRLAAALEREGLERVAIGGGVAANSELRATVRELDVPVWTPPLALCTDNAAMIAGVARFLEPLPYPDYLALDAAARLV